MVCSFIEGIMVLWLLFVHMSIYVYALKKLVSVYVQRTTSTIDQYI
jgi:hypothetical protein